MARARGNAADPEKALHTFLSLLKDQTALELKAAHHAGWQEAQRRGLAIEVPNPKPPKKPSKTPKVFAALAPAGRQFLLDASSPKEALDVLTKRLSEGLSALLAPPDPVAGVLGEVAALRAKLDAIERRVERAQEDHRQAIDTLRETVEAARTVAEKAIAASSVVGGMGGTAPPPLDTQRAEKLVVDFVEQIWEESAVPCSFVQISDHLRKNGASLSPGQFQDVMRGLREQGRVSLAAWGKSMPEIPRQELAFLLFNRVMYNACPPEHGG